MLRNLGLLASLLFVASSFTNAQVQVTLPKGQIKGVLSFSSVNRSREYYSFHSVRYAKPPVGDLRFQPAQEVDAWSDIYDATYEKNYCYQVTGDSSYESEDCLYLNVFTPQNPNTIRELLPVIFFIHGGGFVEGSGYVLNGTGPDFFMDYDVIFVSINYRLGPFGFISTGDAVLPGNLGLKDQNVALKWIQENIKYFGGDPNKVTITGQSAGSASVSFQMLSPLSAGLFRAAILESGTAITPWAYQRDHVEFAYKTAAYIDSRFATNRNSSELFEFLMNVPAKDLDHASFTFASSETAENSQITQGFHYAPAVEVEHNNAFLTQKMYEAFENGNFNKVPVIMGLNAEESMFMISDYINLTLQDFDIHPQYVTPKDMNLSEDEEKNVGNLIRQFYVEGDGKWVDNLASSIKYFSDQSFARSIIKNGELMSKYTDVYFYYFTYHGRMGGNSNELAGTGNVTHGEEQNYLLIRGTFNNDLSQFSQDDVNTHYRFMSLWTNFAKTLQPIPEKTPLINVDWPTVNVEQDGGLKYLNIAKDLYIDTNPRNDMMSFWQNLYDVYGVTPYDTW